MQNTVSFYVLTLSIFAVYPHRPLVDYIPNKLKGRKAQTPGRPVTQTGREAQDNRRLKRAGKLGKTGSSNGQGSSGKQEVQTGREARKDGQV